MYSSMIMSLTRKNRFWFWGMMVAAVLTAYSAVCPYICASAQALEKSSHSCCPKSSQQDQETQKNKSSQCCDQHSHVILKETSTKTSIVYTLKSVFVPVSYNYFVSVDTPFINIFSGDPPNYFPPQPLYLLKNILLI